MEAFLGLLWVLVQTFHWKIPEMPPGGNMYLFMQHCVSIHTNREAITFSPGREIVLSVESIMVFGGWGHSPPIRSRIMIRGL